MNNILITGGNRGIGLAITKKLLDEGYYVISVSREINENLKDIENFEQISADVSSEVSCIDLFEKLKNLNRKFYCIINNAGFSEWRTISQIDQKFLEKMFGVNVFGYFYIIKYGLELLNEKGSILNISSLAAMRGTENNSAYVASKFAIRGLTQSLSKELGKKGIRVNAINPVLIATEGLLKALKSDQSPANGNPEDFLRVFATAQTSLKRLPSAEDVADLACFLIGPKSHAITGQSINVDCGVLPN